jgi:hypothetical protein
MSEYKFACPGCGQRIAVTDEYAGHQINCPACQAAIVVPANPGALPQAPPPPAPPAAPRPGVAVLSSAQPHVAVPAPNLEQQGSAAYQAHVAHKPKKSYTGLIAGVTAVALMGLAAFVGRDWLAGKWKAFHKPSTAEIAATNQPEPAPAPAEPTVAEIWQNVVATYKGLTSLSITGTATNVVGKAQGSAALNTPSVQGLSALFPTSADLSVKLGRPDNFRVDLNQHFGTAAVRIVGWSAGQGYYLMHNNTRRKESSLETVLVGLSSGTGFMAGLFFNEADGVLARAGTDWSRTNGAAISGQPCDVLAGTILFQKALIWVNKRTFLIHQIQIVLDGDTNTLEIDDAKIKEALMAAKDGQNVTPAEITQFKTGLQLLSNVRGTLTETYQDIQTNIPIALAEFEPPPSAAPPAGPPPARGARAGAGAGGGAAPTGGRATRIAAGARRGN